MNCWEEAFGSGGEQLRLIAEAAGSPVAAALLIFKTEWTGPLAIRRAYLNSCAETSDCDTYAEYNDLLVLPGWEDQLAGALRRKLADYSWDELIVRAAADTPAIAALRRAFQDLEYKTWVRTSFFADLADVRRKGVAYEQILSSNTRSQVRRSAKMYAAQGSLNTESARDLETSLAWFDQMVELHKQSWAERGEASQFISPRSLDFHRALIRRLYSAGNIQMLRIMAGQQTIAVLYNLAHEGRIYSYQSGLVYSDDNRLKPGLVAHARAAQFCLDNGWDEYDFLVGEQRYKQSLSTGSRSQTWLYFRRHGVKLALLHAAREFRDAYRKARS
jgi:CelD/BcsL family acetyltransferase involved in cellulose biosynthesis